MDMNHGKRIMVTACIFVALDMLYFTVAGGVFQRLIFKVQKAPLAFNFVGAFLAYIVLFISLDYFILEQQQGPLQAFKLGLAIYAVYELTNYALLKDWSASVVVMDTVWGGIVFALTTFLVQKINF